MTRPMPASRPLLSGPPAAPVQRQIMAADGTALAVFDFPALDPVALAPPLFCLHGISRNSRDFTEFCESVQGLGLRAIAMDVRGRGQSAFARDPESYTLFHYAADVVRVLDALEIPRAVFVGTSMGGLITMILALSASERIAGAVLNDVGPEFTAGALARILRNLAARPQLGSWAEAADHARRINGLAFPAQDQPGHEAFWAEFARRICREEADGTIRLDYDPAISEAALKLLEQDAAKAADSAVTGPGSGMWPAFDALARDGKPLMLVRGAISDFLTPDLADAISARAPQLRRVEVSGTGHAPFLTEEDVWPEIVDFLAEIL